jgi:hypothetical protein
MPCRDHNSCLRSSRALGIYGVISYSVTRQTQEIGIRMAVGDAPATVHRSVLARTLKLALIGVVLGDVASHAVSQTASLLFQTDPANHSTFIPFLLLTVALAAGYSPAQRATRIAVALGPYNMPTPSHLHCLCCRSKGRLPRRSALGSRSAAALVCALGSSLLTLPCSTGFYSDAFGFLFSELRVTNHESCFQEVPQ